jgi:prepilin-type N-terminal cleavage/methylation domain-containing protein
MRVRERGMTLLEILVAVMVFALIMVVMMAVVSTTVSARDRVETLSATTEVFPAIVNLMRRELESVFNPGADRTYFAGARSEVNFLASISGYRSEGNAGTEQFSNVVELGYRLRGGSLMRREQSFVDDDPLVGGVWTEVYDRVRALEFSYVDEQGKEWDTWDSKQRGGLPKHIRIRIELGIPGPDGGEERPVEWSLVVFPRP